MRIAFFTNVYSPIGAFCLHSLLEDGYDVVCVVAVSHKIKGGVLSLIRARGLVFCFFKFLEIIGMKIRERLVKKGVKIGEPRSLREVSVQKNIDIISVDNVNSEKFITFLSKRDVELVISVACPQIFKKALLSLPSKGCLNIHPGLLPKERGPDPIFWSRYFRKPFAGVTAHIMDESIDTGPILVQGRFPILPEDLEADIREKAIMVSPKIMKMAIECIEKSKTGIAQLKDGEYYPIPKRKSIRSLLREISYLFTNSEMESIKYEVVLGVF